MDLVDCFRKGGSIYLFLKLFAINYLRACVCMILFSILQS